MQRWTQEAIALEIINRYEAGESLTYSSMSGTPLLSAAVRICGSWAAAIGFAGLDYDMIRTTKSWNRQAIVDRIQELNAQGVDLSWRHVSVNVDPQLAAAATKKSHFGSWRSAVEAAGLDYDGIRRYQEWDSRRVLTMVREYHINGADLNAKSIVKQDARLITAARRRFDSWPDALSVAGLDFRNIVHRAPFKWSKGRRQR